ncbi:MAG: isoprenylcysteine carboxylmethyltransferase family protein [Bacteroidetes bacterium]|nr:isoprenylcysteine carboxylmethyltransferase family protein [Bacteroidota bacterium]
MFSLFIRNLILTILQPGIVAGLIPYFIARKKINEGFMQNWVAIQYAGCFLFALGLLIMTSCIVSFAVKGKGTLSPADPTKKLVTSGLYRFSRNPMYVGVMLILIGEALFFQAFGLWIYFLIIFFIFNVFTILVEEPRLLKDFGQDYRIYMEKVRRWI